MATRLSAYLNFRDSARQAMEFYQSVLGGKLELNTYGESQASADPAEADKIMHAALTTDDGMALMASDVSSSMPMESSRTIWLSLTGDAEDDTRLRSCWDALSSNGSVLEPLAQAPWGDSFGMCVDQFGVGWMINIAGSGSTPG